MWVALGCGPSPGQPASVLLARHPELLVELELPVSTRAEVLPGGLDIDGFTRVREQDGRVEWVVDLPFRSTSYWRGTRTQPPGMRVTGRKFRARSDDVGGLKTWSVHDDRLYIVTASDDPPSARAVWPQAWADERGLSPATDDRSDVDFALRTMPTGSVREHGLYLPAPGRAVFQVQVPQDGHLWTRVRLLTPAVPGVVESDGASVQLRVDDELVETWSLVRGDSRRVEADLSDWGGQSVRLEWVTDPGLEHEADHVFLTEPILYTPSETPRRVGIVFVDTLRRDAVGVYGDSQATPAMDAFAREARVFDQARAPAPWTLPSARAALTGRHPHRWDEGGHVGELLAEDGFLTASIVANSYLTENFDAGDGWTVHDGLVGREASASVKRARDLLERHEDRDLAVMLHIMEPHLPYPPADVGPAPDGLEGLIAPAAAQAAYDADPANAAYIRARYLAEVERADQAFAELLELLGPGAIVVVFSDHGEELFEHGRIGHGRGLVEELVRVPLLIRAPGLPVGRSEVGATLQDIVPTLAQALELKVEDVDGASLYDEIARPIALGTPLFGDAAVGVVFADRKWVASGATDAAWFLTDDPNEDQPGPSATRDRDRLAEALGMPVHRVIRLAGPGETARLLGGGPVSITVQGGIEAIWTRPGETFEFVEPKAVGDTVTLHLKKHPRELFLLPNDPKATWTVEGGTASWVWRPVEGATSRELDDTIRQELEALGYVE
ncbi:MAG: sulfatase [Proteobacteria bacterium]|nr:sulfatase [Pseudomonadota bacterium]